MMINSTLAQYSRKLTLHDMASMQQIPSFLTEAASQLRVSPTLEINELVNQRLAKGKPIVHLGFGEATFPVQKDVLATHRTASESTSYLPVAGLRKLREVSFNVKLFNTQPLT